jgi:hypothetical protein
MQSPISGGQPDRTHHKLRNPDKSRASHTLNSKIDNLRRLEDAGAAAIVLPSLFQEQIEVAAEQQASRAEALVESSPEALSFPPWRTAHTGFTRTVIST